MTYGLFSNNGRRSVLLIKSVSREYLETLKRTFEYRRQFRGLEIKVTTK
jgi:hypothetical protein